MNAPAQTREKFLRWDNVHTCEDYELIRSQVVVAISELVSHKDVVHGAMTIASPDTDMWCGLMSPGLVLTSRGLAIKDGRNLLVIIPTMFRHLGRAIGLNVKRPRHIEFIEGSWLYVYVAPEDYADIAERFKLSAKDINNKTAELIGKNC